MKTDTFFVLNTPNQSVTTEEYAGYVLFYKRNKENGIAEIQMNLLLRLIENGLKLKMDNFLLVDIAQQKERLSVLKKSMPINKCLLFGVSEKEVGINFDIPVYQLTEMAGIIFLKSDAPEILEKDNNLKAKLWTQLQIAFKS